MRNIKFSMQFRGTGFDKKIENKDEQFDEPPSKRIITEINGPGKFMLGSY